MSFPKYPRYKPSGVEWLGEVPEHWKVTRLRRLVHLNPSKSETAALPTDSLVSFLPMEAIGENGSLDLERQRVLSEVASGYSYFRNGDVVVAKITPCFENGKGALLRSLTNSCGFGTTELIVMRPDTTSLEPEFLHRLVTSNSFRKLGEASMYGAGGQKRVPDDFVREFPSPLPPLPEQRAIAAFLDRETAKIDALIAEQEKLIELLAEKRQAVISHAVTKGLNPAAPMKPSGIEWLGDVPEHWQIQRLKHTVPALTVGIVVEPSKYYVETGVPALRSLNVQPGRITLAELVYISDSANELHGKSRLRAGDIVAVRSGQPGTAAIVPDELDGCNCVDLIIIRGPVDGSSPYLCWFLAADAARVQVAHGSDGAIQQHFNISTAAQLLVTRPPKREQDEIVRFLNHSIASIDVLQGEAGMAVTLLRERRSALISAAVTGQIDVRNAVPESAA